MRLQAKESAANSISDKTISGAIRSWRRGAFGTLGFQYFYAGRKNTGIGQCLVGIFLWGMLIRCFFEQNPLKEKLMVAAFLAALLAALSVLNYRKIKKGELQDEFGANIVNK